MPKHWQPKHAPTPRQDNLCPICQWDVEKFIKSCKKEGLPDKLKEQICAECNSEKNTGNRTSKETGFQKPKGAKAMTVRA